MNTAQEKLLAVKPSNHHQEDKSMIHTANEVDDKLARLAASQLAIIEASKSSSPPQPQKNQGVPGFPDFPDCWWNPPSDEVEDERARILADAAALKKAAQQVRYRLPLRRQAVNKFGIGRNKNTHHNTTKPKLHKRGGGRKHEISQLGKRLKNMRLTVKCKLEPVPEHSKLVIKGIRKKIV